MLANPAQVSLNAIIKRLLFVLIGLMTPAACAALGFVYLDNIPEYRALYDPFHTAIAIALAAFFFTDAGCQVFSASIDTIYLCTFKDMAENKPPKYMSNRLRKAFGVDEAEVESGTDVEETKSKKVAPAYEEEARGDCGGARQSAPGRAAPSPRASGGVLISRAPAPVAPVRVSLPARVQPPTLSTR